MRLDRLYGPIDVCGAYVTGRRGNIMNVRGPYDVEVCHDFGEPSLHANVVLSVYHDPQGICAALQDPLVSVNIWLHSSDDGRYALEKMRALLPGKKLQAPRVIVHARVGSKSDWEVLGDIFGAPGWVRRPDIVVKYPLRDTEAKPFARDAISALVATGNCRVFDYPMMRAEITHHFAKK